MLQNGWRVGDDGAYLCAECGVEVVGGRSWVMGEG